MKKGKAVFLLFSLLSVFAAGCAYAAGSYEDTFLDKTGDWFATLGKPADEKDSILAERRAKRAAEHFKKDMKEIGAKADKKSKELGKEMKNLFNN